MSAPGWSGEERRRQQICSECAEREEEMVSLAVLKSEMSYIKKSIDEIKESIIDMKECIIKTYITRAEFDATIDPIRRIVYGTVAVMLTGVIGAIMFLVLKK